MAGIKATKLGMEMVSTDKKHRVQVMRAKGYSNAQIAETVGLSEATVARILCTSERS